MECTADSGVRIAKRVGRTIAELRALQEPLLAGEVDATTLVDFRDALNRVRNTAWAAQQSASAALHADGPATVASMLALARIRAAYQLCQLIREDMRREDIELQKGTLVQFCGIAQELVNELKDRLKLS